MNVLAEPSWVWEGGVLSCGCGYSGDDRQHPGKCYSAAWLQLKADDYATGARMARQRDDTDDATVLEVICDHLRELATDLRKTP